MYNGEKVNPCSHFTAAASFNEIVVIVGEPQIKNLNSFENIQAIVRTIASQANIKLYSDRDKESREWLFFENDGESCTSC